MSEAGLVSFGLFAFAAVLCIVLAVDECFDGTATWGGLVRAGIYFAGALLAAGLAVLALTVR